MEVIPMFAKIKKFFSNNTRSKNHDLALDLKKKGDLCVREERLEQAIEYYRQALSLSPQFYEGLIAIGFALHEKGSIDDAAQYLHQALSISPENADVQFMLGNIAKKQGDSQRAIEHYRHAIKSDPEFGFAYRALFGIFQEQGDAQHAKEILDKAMLALPTDEYFIFERADFYFAAKDYQNTIRLFQKMLQLSPNDAAIHVNIAVSLMSLDQNEAAIHHFEQAAKLEPDNADIHQNLGNVYVKLNRKHEAIAPYKEVLRIDPNHPVKHIIAAFSGDTTSTAPAGYIANLFDGYAEKFDSHLVKDLHYNTPSVLLSTIQSHVNLSARQLDVLDLGCGTGLFGKVISPFVGQMVGVDLSAKMLEKAAVLNIYHRLECKDLLAMMRSEPNASYDLIAAADVFVYIGTLDELVIEAKRLLRHNGIFAFSTESLDALSKPTLLATPPNFVLNDTARYAHALSYLNKLARDSGFSVLEIKEEVIRVNEGTPVIGYLSVWHR
jgi:predicted TPR repeat methyltransferase